MNIRLLVVRLLISLLRHQARHVQEVVLENPTAVSKVMDLLQDRREVVRNEVITKLYQNFLKIVKNFQSKLLIVMFEKTFVLFFQSYSLIFIVLFHSFALDFAAFDRTFARKCEYSKNNCI